MHTYALALHAGKFYVGRTTNLDRRLTQHFTNKGAKWCRQHGAARVLMVRPGDCERELTLELMRKYGVERVRGGPWCRCDPIDEPVELRSTDSQKAHRESKAMVTTLAKTSISDWVIGPAQKNKHGANEWPISVAGTKSHPRLQPVSNDLPMRTPFGISQYNDQGSFSINFSVAPYQKEVQEFFTALDKFILDWAWENRRIFAKVPTSREVLESMYTPLLAPARGDYEPLLRAKTSEKVPVWLVTDGSPVKGSSSDVTPGSSCVPVLSIEKIWVMAGRFGCTMRCQALICHPRKEASFQDMFGDVEMFAPVQQL